MMAATTDDATFLTLVSRIQSEGGETITSGRLVSLIRDTTGNTKYQSCLRRLVRHGHLQTLRATGANAYLIRKPQVATGSMLAEGPPLEVVPATPQAPGIQRIRAAAEKLSIAVEAFRQLEREKGLGEVLALPDRNLKALAKLVKDAADYARGFGEDLEHLADIADRLRANRGFTMADEEDDSSDR